LVDIFSSTAPTAPATTLEKIYSRQIDLKTNTPGTVGLSLTYDVLASQSKLQFSTVIIAIPTVYSAGVYPYNANDFYANSFIMAKTPIPGTASGTPTTTGITYLTNTDGVIPYYSTTGALAFGSSENAHRFCGLNYLYTKVTAPGTVADGDKYGFVL
jgi:hypothetical protein